MFFDCMTSSGHISLDAAEKCAGLSNKGFDKYSPFFQLACTDDPAFPEIYCCAVQTDALKYPEYADLSKREKTYKKCLAATSQCGGYGNVLDFQPIIANYCTFLQIDNTQASAVQDCMDTAGHLGKANSIACAKTSGKSISTASQLFQLYCNNYPAAADVYCCTLQADVKTNADFQNSNKRIEAYQKCVDKTFPCKKQEAQAFMDIIQPFCDKMDEAKAKDFLDCMSLDGHISSINLVSCAKLQGFPINMYSDFFCNKNNLQGHVPDIYCCAVYSDQIQHPLFANFDNRKIQYNKCLQQAFYDGCKEADAKVFIDVIDPNKGVLVSKKASDFMDCLDSKGHMTKDSRSKCEISESVDKVSGDEDYIKYADTNPQYPKFYCCIVKEDINSNPKYKSLIARKEAYVQCLDDTTVCELKESKQFYDVIQPHCDKLTTRQLPGGRFLNCLKDHKIFKKYVECFPSDKPLEGYPDLFEVLCTNDEIFQTFYCCVLSTDLGGEYSIDGMAQRMTDAQTCLAETFRNPQICTDTDAGNYREAVKDLCDAVKDFSAQAERIYNCTTDQQDPLYNILISCIKSVGPVTPDFVFVVDFLCHTTGDLSNDLYCCVVERISDIYPKYKDGAVRVSTAKECLQKDFSMPKTCSTEDARDFDTKVTSHCEAMDQKTMKGFADCLNDNKLITKASVNQCFSDYDIDTQNNDVIRQKCNEDFFLGSNIYCCILYKDVDANPNLRMADERKAIFHKCLGSIGF